MPNPKSGESKQDFISRFMSSEEAKRDYPDQDQRLAVAYSKFETRKENMDIQKSRSIIKNNLNLVMKAKQGDSRMIFGKPYEYDGSKWVQTGPNVTTDDAPDEISGEQVIDRDEQDIKDMSQEDFDTQNALDELGPIDEIYTSDEDISSHEGKEWKSPGDKWEELKNAGIGAEQWAEDPENPTNQEIEDAYEFFNEMDAEDEEYDDFDTQNAMDELMGKSKDCEEVKKSASVVKKNLAGVYDSLKPYGVTMTTDNHSHSYTMDRDGNGITDGIVGEYAVDHTHEIKNYEVKSAQNHTHELLR